MISVSRRSFFSTLSRPFRGNSEPLGDRRIDRDTEAQSTARIAVIQGRFCLALTSFCSACSERCPVPGAMKKERGLPMVVADACTGCGICQEVCPAPHNAVLLLPRRPSTPPSATISA